ncbi:MAG: SlyX family protein [Treponema sp.]|nr:SlyX family protein [Treponema sp.]
MEETENRFVALEMKVSYLEDFLSQLQESCVEQGKIIEKLQTENKLMAQKIREMSDTLEGDIPNRKPPHY